MRAQGFDLVIVETAGIGQSDSAIVDLVDVSLYVMTAEYGAASQLEKIDMLDLAGILVLNKFDKRGSQDALRDVRKQWRRNHLAFTASDDEVPVFPTTASQFDDPGVTLLFAALCRALTESGLAGGGAVRAGAPGRRWRPADPRRADPARADGLPRRDRAAGPRDRRADRAVGRDRRHGAPLLRGAQGRRRSAAARALRALSGRGARGGGQRPAPTRRSAPPTTRRSRTRRRRRRRARSLPARIEGITSETYSYDVRGRPVTGDNYRDTLSGLRVPKIAAPRFSGWGDQLRFLQSENLPGSYPYTAGVFPYRRADEDPIRMFAGEGTPEQTNRRFHYLSAGQPAARLSTAFDSVTLYGEDPHPRPDIYGKVGNSGVSIATVDDAKRLYSGSISARRRRRSR